MLHIPGLFMAPSANRGNGMFTAQDLEIGDMIEVCPYIEIPQKDLATIHQTILHDYYFLLPNEKGNACIALGYGSIYNHSSKPNARLIFDLENNMMEFECLQKITSGEEIFIDYTGGTKNVVALWFTEK